MIPTICQVIMTFKDSAEIIWRSYLCLHQACAAKGCDVCCEPNRLPHFVPCELLAAEITQEVLRHNIHEVMAEIYEQFDDCR